MIIPTPRLILRPLEASDARELAREADDPRVAEHLRDGFSTPYTLRDARKFIASMRDADPLEALGIAHDGSLIGVVGVSPGHDVFRLTGEVGYWLGVAHWGQGFATEALGAFMAGVWTHSPFERVFANVFSGNPASERVLAKCGFTLESVQRRAVFKNGVVRDSAVWVQLRDGE